MNKISETADSIRAMRRERQMSMKMLGSRCGLSAAYICDIENGTRQPPKETVNKIAEALGCLTVPGVRDCCRCGGSGKEPIVILRGKGVGRKPALGASADGGRAR